MRMPIDDVEESPHDDDDMVDRVTKGLIGLDREKKAFRRRLERTALAAVVLLVLVGGAMVYVTYFRPSSEIDETNGSQSTGVQQNTDGENLNR